MEVHGIGSAFRTSPVSRPQQASQAEGTPPSRPAPIEDSVEFTAPEHLREAAAGKSSDLKAVRLEQIQAAIQAGTYETSEKFEVALERLLDRIGLQNTDD